MTGSGGPVIPLLALSSARLAESCGHLRPAIPLTGFSRVSPGYASVVRRRRGVPKGGGLVYIGVGLVGLIVILLLLALVF
jgi:hypothetical protein